MTLWKSTRNTNKWITLTTWSGQRVLTKGRIAPTLAASSILKPRFRRNAPSLRTSLQPRAAAAVASNVFQCTPNIARSNGTSEPPHITRFLGATGIHKPNGISIGSAAVLWRSRLWPTYRQTDRHTDRHRPGYDCSNRPHLCTRCIRCGLT